MHSHKEQIRLSGPADVLRPIADELRARGYPVLLLVNAWDDNVDNEACPDCGTRGTHSCAITNAETFLESYSETIGISHAYGESSYRNDSE